MKILIINNYDSKNRLGGVEHYLHELINYAEKSKSNITFKWFGKSKIKTNWNEKINHKTITQEIIQEIDTFQPDVIHCFSIGAPVTPQFMKYAKLKGIPIVFSFRDYYYICPKNYMITDKNEVIKHHESGLACILHHTPKRNILFDTLLHFKQSLHKKIIKKHIDYFLTPSDNLTQFVKNHFQKPGKTLPNPILFEQNLISNSEGNYILFVGRLVPEKGVLTLLKTFQNISKQFPSEKLWVVGDGNQKEELQNFAKNNKIENVLTLKTSISQIKNIAPDETIGYGRRGKLAGSGRIATLAIGYADGYSRALGMGKGSFEIKGHLCPTVGSICMDMCMVDISQFPDISVEDTAIAFGGKIQLYELAKQAETIPYELMTNISERVKRVYVTQ